MKDKYEAELKAILETVSSKGEEDSSHPQEIKQDCIRPRKSKFQY